MHKNAAFLFLLVAPISNGGQPTDDDQLMFNVLDSGHYNYLYSHSTGEIYIDKSTPIDDETVCTLASKSNIQSLKIIKDLENRIVVTCK